MFFCAPADNKVMKSITAIHIIFILFFFYKIGREKKQKNHHYSSPFLYRNVYNLLINKQDVVD